MRVAALLLAVAACGGGGPPAPKVAPTPVTAVAQSASSQEIDSLWTRAQRAIRNGKWNDAVKHLDRALLEFAPGDGRASQAHFLLGEAHFATGSQLTAAREFRKVSDETPNDPLAARGAAPSGRCLRRSLAPSGARPVLRPDRARDLSGVAESVSRWQRRPSGPRTAIDDLKERFAYKEYKAALYYFRLKAYDSAILYLKDVVATYPRASVAPAALIKLVQAYRNLGYKEDVQETCGYIRRFHPETPRACARSVPPIPPRPAEGDDRPSWRIVRSGSPRTSDRRAGRG